MQNLQWYVRRLRSMDVSEIAWRVRSLLRDQLDVARIPMGLIPSLPKSLTKTSTTYARGFSASPIDRKAWAANRGEEKAAWQAKLQDQATSILRNELSYFDLENVFHGDPIEWHKDHSAGIQGPNRLCIHTDYRDFKTNGDCKLVWEPNRHHQLVVLARAYVADGNDEYANKIAELLQSWIKDNPFGYGMNWKSPLELGVRTINWIWALDLIRESDAISDELWHNVLETLYRMMWDSQRKFSRGSSANNHLIGEVAGVFIATCYFPNFPNATEWQRECLHILEKEIISQTYDDGCTREHAFNYQFFVMQFFTLSLLAGQKSGVQFSEAFHKRLHEIYRFVFDLSFDTESPPNMGDADDGYVLNLGDLPNNPANLLAVGSELFADEHLASSQMSETAYWLFGNDQPTTRAADKRMSSSVYPNSGYFILRGETGPAGGAPPMSAFFDCADLGYGAIAAHGHADCLSICLSIAGKPFFVDPGTYDYFSHPNWREYFRQTRAHNTVEINGQSQSESLGPFLWGNQARAEVLNFEDSNEYTFVTGRHFGYVNQDASIIHERQLRLQKNLCSLEIVDRIESNSTFQAKIFFHCHPACEIDLVDSGVRISNNSSAILLTCQTGRFEVVAASSEEKLGWISEGYHKRKPSHCIILTPDAATSGEITSRIDLAE